MPGRKGTAWRLPKGEEWAPVDHDWCETTLPVMTISEKHNVKPGEIWRRVRRKSLVRPEGAPKEQPAPFVRPPASGYGIGGAAMGLGTGGPPIGGARPFEGDPRQARGAAVPTPKSLAAREQAERMLRVLADIADDPGAQVNARVAAATAVMNRVLGMPKAQVNISTDDAGKMTDDELAAIAGGGG